MHGNVLMAKTEDQTESIRELIEKCSKGDIAAVKELYLHYSPMIFAICMRYMDNRHKAQDLTHDCFLKILDKLDKYQPTGSFSSWITKLTVNHLTDYFRREKKLVFSEDSSLEWENNPVLDWDEAWIHQQKMEQIRKMMQQLPQTKRIIFNLFYIEGLSHKQIAKRLGITETASAIQIYKARQLMIKWIQYEDGK